MASVASFYELEAEKPSGDKIKFEVRPLAALVAIFLRNPR